MTLEQSKTAIQYDPFAKKYADSFLKYNQESISAYFRHLALDLHEKNVLDLGCGTGHDLFEIQKKGAKIFGVDSSVEMVKLAQQKNPLGEIYVSQFDRTPFSDKTFDLIISKWALQTANSIDPIYKEVIRLLKPNGKFIYLVCHPIRQFMEKKKNGKNYFKKEFVRSVFFGGTITAIEPSHTLQEYMSPFFFDNFVLESFEEGIDAASEKVNGDVYPGYFILQARLKNRS